MRHVNHEEADNNNSRQEQQAAEAELQSTDQVPEEAAATEPAEPEPVQPRPSQRKKKTVFDQVWEFFSSVRVGVTIIVLLTISSAIGTIYPQANAIPSPNPEFYYSDTYGRLGEIYFRLGLHKTFSTWWFMTLVLLLAIALIIVSIDRGVPLYRSLKNQPVKRKVISIRADRLYAHKEAASEADLDQLEASLKKRRYKIRREEGGLLAEKGRFPRFGAYVIHTGLIIIIIGVFTRLIPGWYYTDMVWIKQDQRVNVKGLDFAIQNNGFTLEYYDDAHQRVKKYETDVAVYQNDKEMAQKHLLVNDYLVFNHTHIYQNSFDPNPMFKSAKISLIDKKSGKSLGMFDYNFDEPQPSYKVGDYTLTVVNYFPDIRIDKDKGIYTNSRDPYNPGIQLDIKGPGMTEPSRQWMMPLAPFVEQMLGKEWPFTLKIEQAQAFNMTGLKVERDLGIPIVYGGLAIVLFGLTLVFYFQHRRIWANLEDEVVHIGANTNKNWLGMTNELNKALGAAGFEPAVLKSKTGKK
jgi:cytochrome c biogenesis protein